MGKIITSLDARVVAHSVNGSEVKMWEPLGYDVRIPKTIYIWTTHKNYPHYFTAPRLTQEEAYCVLHRLEYFAYGCAMLPKLFIRVGRVFWCALLGKYLHLRVFGKYFIVSKYGVRYIKTKKEP